MSDPTPTPSPYSSKEAWTATILEAFNGPDETVESTFLKLYTRDTIIKMDGKTYDFAAFLTQAMYFRSIAVSFDLKSQCFLRDGNMFAEKHTFIATMKQDGTRAAVEAYLFAELDADSKAIWVDEQPRTIEA
ncbi:hypothetical protein B0H66DRAFT_565687 [Apodospora peruviana]|uniref:SnoaL-like domain-containing protein n=1 Tax=Apodospora peruviana TaxID=516989 RepID=A0AAE0HZA3_9PEZI|nr:hypothetical protein B0H66DRAFT_565687 [Apodospora peruviana]